MDDEDLVDNKATKKVLESMTSDNVVYGRETTEMFFKAFWIIATVMNFGLIWHFTASASLQSHFVSFVMGAIALKIYGIIPDYMDLAEEVGAVAPEEELEDG